MDVRFRLFVVKMLLQNYLSSHHQDVHLMLLMFLEEVISTKDLHLFYYDTIPSYPNISNFQCRQFEINTLLNEVEMLTFVDFFHLKREAVESKKGCAISKK